MLNIFWAYFLLLISTNLKNSSRNSCSSSGSWDCNLELPQHTKCVLRRIAFMFLSSPIVALICWAISPQYSSFSSMVSIFLRIHCACFRRTTSDLYDSGWDFIICIREKRLNTYGIALCWFLEQSQYAIVYRFMCGKTSDQVFFILFHSYNLQFSWYHNMHSLEGSYSLYIGS